MYTATLLPLLWQNKQAVMYLVIELAIYIWTCVNSSTAY